MFDKLMLIVTLLTAVAAQHYCLKKVKEEMEYNTNACIGAHNNARRNFGVQLARWSDSLAAQAQQYANFLNSRGQMFHSSSGDRGGAGENLYQSSGGASCQAAVNSWVSENYQNQVLTSGNIMSIGHHSQIVWGSTREIGCGVAGGTVVCRYRSAQSLNQRAK